MARMIRRFLDLLQIVRYADHPTSPCWLTSGRSPRRRSCLPSITGYCTLRPPPRAAQNFCATIPLFSDYRRYPTIIAQQPVVLVGEDFWINCGVMRRRRSNCCKSGLGIVYCRIHLQQKISGRSTGPEEWEKHYHPSPAGTAWESQRRVSIHSVSKRSVGLWGRSIKLGIVPDAMLLRPWPGIGRAAKRASAAKTRGYSFARACLP